MTTRRFAGASALDPIDLDSASAEDLVDIHQPSGVGVYIRAIGKNHPTPKTAAKIAKNHGVSFVVILGVWQDIHKGEFRHLTPNFRDNRITRYAEAFASEGIMPWVWGFPWAGAEERFVEDMFVAAVPPIVGIWYDPELGYKYQRKLETLRSNTNMRGQPEAIKGIRASGTKATRTKQAKRLMNLTFDEMRERHGLVVTSYGITVFHENFPWEAFGGKGCGSPQLYSTPAGAIANGINQWRSKGWEHIIPSVGTFGKKSSSPAVLHNHLSNFVDDDERIGGFCFWSWKQTSREEWDVLARWADWFQRGIPRTSPGDKIIAVR